MRPLFIGVFMSLLRLITSANGAVTIDRIAVIVGRHAVKLSDIDLDIRLTAFLNRGSSAETPEVKRKSAERLVEQQIIRNELATGGYARASDAEAEAMLKQIRDGRFARRDDQLKRSMAEYGLSEDQVKAQLLWQLTVLKFIDQRFRAGVLVTDEEVRAWYDQHPEVQKVAFEKASAQIRGSLEGDRINRDFEAWLDEARKGTHIEYREAALK